MAAAGEFEINCIEQNFDLQEDAMIQQNNMDILPQMLTNNQLRDRYFWKKYWAREQKKKSNWTYVRWLSAERQQQHRRSPNIS